MKRNAQPNILKQNNPPRSKSADFDVISFKLPQAYIASDKVQLSLVGTFQQHKDKALALPLQSPNG